MTATRRTSCALRFRSAPDILYDPGTGAWTAGVAGERSEAMKFFVDTADIAEIKSLAASGLLDGVTTNPSLVAKSGRKIAEVIREICELVPGPVSAEVAATDYDPIMAEAKVLRAIAPNVTIKVPLTPDGLRACKALSSDGAMVNVTLCFSAAQA